MLNFFMTYNVQDNPPNGPTEKALSARLIVIEANDVESAGGRVGSGSSSGYAVLVSALVPDDD